MFKGLGNISKMMEQVTKMQEEMKKTQESIAAQTFTGESGAGAVKVIINGAYKIQSLTIDPSIIDKDEKDILEDLIVAAINDAIVKASSASSEEMAKISKGLPIPPGMNLPF